jgi:hypothetical protein
VARLEIRIAVARLFNRPERAVQHGVGLVHAWLHAKNFSFVATRPSCLIFWNFGRSNSDNYLAQLQCHCTFTE